MLGFGGPPGGGGPPETPGTPIPANLEGGLIGLNDGGCIIGGPPAAFGTNIGG